MTKLSQFQARDAIIGAKPGYQLIAAEWYPESARRAGWCQPSRLRAVALHLVTNYSGEQFHPVDDPWPWTVEVTGAIDRDDTRGAEPRGRTVTA